MKHPLPNTMMIRSCQRMAGIALLLLLGLAQPAWAALVVNAGNGTVTDSTTSLAWDQCPYGLSGSTCTTGTALLGTWQQALDAAVAANASNYKGFNDWRVPNINELESITKIDSYTAGQPAIDTTAFPNTPITGDSYGFGGTWTSTTYAPLPSEAWFAGFGDGLTVADYKTNTYYVRLVRGGQSFASFDLFPPASADLSITKTDGVTTAVPGGSVTYTITASNAGPSAVAGATVADTFPASLTATWTCVGAAGGTCAASGSGNLNDSTVSLPVGASVTYTVSATVSAAATGTLSNTATVSSATTDPTPANNSATDSDTVTATADLAITVTDAPDPVTAGANLTYTVTVGNSGPSAAATASWSDTLPAGTTFVSLNTAAGWSCTTPAVGASGTVACSNASVTAASSAGFTLVVAVAPATPAATVLTNTVTVSSATSDPTPGNNSASTTTTVSAVVIVPPPPPPPPEVTIPLLSMSPACGLVAGPSIVNLSAGEGPAFTADMVVILSNTLGMPLRFVEQTAACGSVVLSGYNGGNLTFSPYGFQTGDGRANGIYALGDGRYQVVRGGQSLTIAPAVVRLDQLLSLFPGVNAGLGDNGVLTASLNGLTYVVQPGVAVPLDPATGSAQLTMGADGYWHFIDALGNNQILYPAFASPAMLRNALQGLDLGVTFAIQLDGTASIVFKGQHYTLVPDLTLAPVPADRLGQYWWQESAARFWVVNAQPLGTAQGFTVKP